MYSQSVGRSRPIRWWWIAVLPCVVLVGWSLTALGPKSEVRAQTPPASGTDVAPIALDFVPRDSVLVLGARVSRLSAKPLLAGAARILPQQPRPEDFPWGVPPGDVDEVVAALAMASLGAGPEPLLIVRFSSAKARERNMEGLAERATKILFGDTPYMRVSARQFYFEPDNRTVVWSATEAMIRRGLAAGQGGAAGTNWAAHWSSLSRKDAVLVANTALIRGMPLVFDAISQELGRNSRSSPGAHRLASQVAPLWEDTEYVAASLAINDQLDLRIVSQSHSDDDAKQAESGFMTALSLLRAGLSTARGALAKNSSLEHPLPLANLDFIDGVLERAQVGRRDTQAGVGISLDAKASQSLVALALPAVSAGVDNQRASAGINNLRQIGLAFHNYHDAYKVFPSATQIGPKNVPHSWRVTLLPFLEQKELYDSYRQDEPWDSPHNRQLLDKIPEVYRSGNDQRSSTNTSYFTLTGPTTIFRGGESDRPHIANILDGTSNTILIVETKRPVPWTKPEDIPFDPEKPLPELGGWNSNGFRVTMADGSVQFIPKNLDPEIIRRLIMAADGGPVQLPK